MQRNSGSFRDPSGFVHEDGHKIIRTIHSCYQHHWEAVCAGGLMQAALQRGWVIPHKEIPPLPAAWKSLDVDRVPFISYPYEWCFSQLKDAALLTLNLQRLALDFGCTLKDASAFNIQFTHMAPQLIDLLSFERRPEDMPWQGYAQFCTHFLAPLALMAKCDPRLGLLSRQWIDGIPLEIATRILPFSARLSPNMFIHLYMHAAMQAKHNDGRKSVQRSRAARLSTDKLRGLLDSLEATIQDLHLTTQRSEWSDYYQDTNYTQRGAEHKFSLVQQLAQRYAGALAVDMGANTGHFSHALAPNFHCVVAADGDALAVEQLYLHLKEKPCNILPIVLDIANPTPALGWANVERHSFTRRCKADMLTALALCHHLVISAGIPLPQIANHLAELIKAGGVLVVEFVPMQDSQVQRLLAARDNIFDDYTLAAFRASFTQSGLIEEECTQIADSLRTLHVWKKK